MSMDKSLKSHGALARHRNVLTRAERVEARRKKASGAKNAASSACPRWRIGR